MVYFSENIIRSPFVLKGPVAGILSVSQSSCFQIDEMSSGCIIEGICAYSNNKKLSDFIKNNGIKIYTYGTADLRVVDIDDKEVFCDNTDDYIISDQYIYFFSEITISDRVDTKTTYSNYDCFYIVFPDNNVMSKFILLFDI